MLAALIALACALILVLLLFAWTLQVKEVAIRRMLADQREERTRWLRELGEMSKAQAEERRALADRIQHPERIQVQPNTEFVPFEPEEDLAEMAYVGQVVPEFVQVGTSEAEMLAHDQALSAPEDGLGI
jgi:hypothetical protein